ncbi:unnamed protein product [Clonostachys byssicola]|uniref:Uncharacterized protein n=1 Tax=Clonostachys byssicola TaxID=160290 RepID=A0A9N9UPZ0_9HYPO|nr:unnamed protein product [Clonostachys byssicola]
MANVQEPSPPVLDASDRIPEAPILSVTLSCPPTLGWNRTEFRIQFKVTYLGASDSSTHSAEPIIFNKWGFLENEGLCRGTQLFHFHDDRWEAVEEDVVCTGAGFVDDPDVAVCPANHKNFIRLAPGESWTFNTLIQEDTWNTLPQKTKLGDKFRFIFKGAEVDWWVWGGAEQHQDTTVMLSCYEGGPVRDPAGNEGRPKLLVPGSNWVQWTVVE